jgi:type IV secretion system protein VirB1
MLPEALVWLALACAPQVDAMTVRALVSVESAGNPHAIGVVGGALTRQPRNGAEAIATARALRNDGWNFSVGLAQINRSNFERLGLTLDNAFQPCVNLRAMQTVLGECYARTTRTSGDQAALRHALSCYYSGNFKTGFDHGYVRRVVDAMRSQALKAANGSAKEMP